MYSTLSPFALADSTLIWAWLPLFNAAGLFLSIILWYFSDQALLRRKYGALNALSKAERRECMKTLRANYFYYGELSIFVFYCPLRMAMNQKRGPSLGPVLALLFFQAIPVVSHFCAIWYVFTAVLAVSKSLVAVIKARTPAGIKNLLFAAWF